MTSKTEEEMGIKNGRSSYEELKKNYDKVIVRHHKDEDGTARTTCFLVSENTVHVGVAKFSNRTFNFSKKKGHAIARGRAEFAALVHSNKVNKRTTPRREELSFSVTATEGYSTESILNDFLHSSES